MLRAEGLSNLRSMLRWPHQLWRRILLVCLFVLTGMAAIDLLLPPPLTRMAQTSIVVTDRHGAALRAFPVEDGKWRLKADVDTVDPKFIEALLAYEDKRFYQHAGVDPVALVRAALSSLSAGRIVSGGSTLSMQTARLLEPRRRTLGAKMIEAFRAMQLDWRYSKKDILEIYLTLAPYGGNLEGVRAASWAWFGREPDHLSPDQIAMLIALPQSPEARRPDLRPKNAVTARRRVLERLANEGVFAPDLATESADYPAPVRREFPTLAWHASETVRAQQLAARKKATRRPLSLHDIRTTLDLSLQRELEALAARIAKDDPTQSQVAILAVAIDGREVRASVGSADRNRAGGWIDLTNRPRSPGSTLKPLIYGLAFDDGIAAPNTRIQDAPHRFASYRPENFDRLFRGDVTIAEALQHSLNVPAVMTLDAVGPRRFLSTLAFSGAHPEMPKSAGQDDGLAVALGGVGLTARDLAVLYAALGDDGRALPLNWTPPTKGSPKKKSTPTPQIMSAGSAQQILDILKRAPTPSGRMPARLTQGAPEIAFKTGTSYGYRDAWAAGVSRGYVVIVWTGRADSAPRPATTGRDAALPVLFEAFDAIERLLPESAAAGPVLRDTEDHQKPPAPMVNFEDQAAPPQILFPPDESEIWFDQEHTSFVLSATGNGRMNWFVDGVPIQRSSGGDVVWRPSQAGFYSLTVSDAVGRRTQTHVRVRSPGD